MTNVLRHAALLALIGGTVLVSQPACSLIVDNDAEQCATNADCEALGPDFVGYTCQQELKVCVKKTGFCNTNAECIDRNGGAPAICRLDDNKRECQVVLSQACPTTIPPAADAAALLKNDNQTVILGSSIPLTGLFAAPGKASEHIMNLLWQDFNTQMGGVPGLDGKVHPLIFLECDEGQPNPENYIIAMKRDLLVQAEAGGFSSAASIGIAQKGLIPSEMLGVMPVPATGILKDFPGKRDFIYRLDAIDQPQAKEMVQVVAFWEKELRTAGVVKAGENLRIMVGAQGDPLTKTSLPFFESALKFNCENGTCRTADITAAKLDGTLYKVTDIGTPSITDTYAAGLAAGVAATLAYKPHIIINFTGAQVLDYFNAVEKQWPAAEPFKPRWVVTTPAASGAWPAAINGTEADPAIAEGRRNRVLGTLAGPSPLEPEAGKLLVKYQQNFASDTTATYAYAVPQYFDAGYKLLLGVLATAAAKQPLTARNIGSHMRDSQGTGPQVVPSDTNGFQAAFGYFSQGTKINYIGASGNTVFDEFNDARPNLYTYCLNPMPAGAATTPAYATVTYSGQRYDEATDTLINMPVKCGFKFLPPPTP